MSKLVGFMFLLIVMHFFACQTKQVSQEVNGPSEDTTHVRLEQIIGGLENPVYITHAGDGSKRLFIIQQSGEILILKDSVINKEPFLNISDRVFEILPAFTELGLLGLTFHPNYLENGRFFVYYSHQYNADSTGFIARLSEFHVNPQNPDFADIGSERIVMEIACEGLFVNGGHIAFGPDGMLYIGIGEGSAGTEKGSKGNAQNLENLYGSILRIDINKEQPYHIPEDNIQAGLSDDYSIDNEEIC